MKKILVVIGLVITMITGTVFAEATADATLYYYKDDSFYVTIPSEIQVGEQNSITADNINIGANKHVYVALENGGTSVPIYSTTDSSQSVEVYFQNENGDTNPIIASFAMGESGTSKIFSTYVSDSESALAGEYMGSVTFRIYCE